MSIYVLLDIIPDLSGVGHGLRRECREEARKTASVLYGLDQNVSLLQLTGKVSDEDAEEAMDTVTEAVIGHVHSAAGAEDNFNQISSSWINSYDHQEAYINAVGEALEKCTETHKLLSREVLFSKGFDHATARESHIEAFNEAAAWSRNSANNIRHFLCETSRGAPEGWKSIRDILRDNCVFMPHSFPASDERLAAQADRLPEILNAIYGIPDSENCQYFKGEDLETQTKHSEIIARDMEKDVMARCLELGNPDAIATFRATPEYARLRLDTIFTNTCSAPQTQRDCLIFDRALQLSPYGSHKSAYESQREALNEVWGKVGPELSRQSPEVQRTLGSKLNRRAEFDPRGWVGVASEMP